MTRESHKCPKCPKEFPRKSDFSLHFRKSHAGLVKEIKCTQIGCTTKFTSTEDFKIHVANEHPDLECYTCDTCGKGFTNKRARYAHVVATHSGKSFPCNLCEQVLKHKHSLENHVAKIHSQMIEEVKTEKNEEEKGRTSVSSKKRKIYEVKDDDPVEDEMVKPFVRSILTKKNSIETKTKCLSAIEALVSKDIVDLKCLAKKEFIDEIFSIAEEIIDNIEVDQPDKDLSIIANMLSKINSLEEGKKLIKQVRVPIGAYERLRAEMKRFLHASSSDQTNSNPSKKAKVILNRCDQI